METMSFFIIVIVIMGICLYACISEMNFWKKEAEQLHGSLSVVRGQWDAAKVLLPADVRRSGDDAIRESYHWCIRPEITGGTP